MVVFRNIFSRKLFTFNHFQSIHFSKSKKCIKTTVTFGIDFFLLLAFIICTCLSVLLLFISGFFYVNISVSGLSGKISLHGSKQLSLYS